MKRSILAWVGFGWLCGGLLAGATRAEVEIDWAYHARTSGIDTRSSERVPGADFCFVGGCSTRLSSQESVVLYLLTANDFAGDEVEQVWVRWWNGSREHWAQGHWEGNVALGDGALNDEGARWRAASFRGLPDLGVEKLDLWKIVVPPQMTEPGMNFYSIQLKSSGEAGETVRFLIRNTVTLQGPVNNLGQAWAERLEDVYDRDWSIEIVE